MFIYVHFPLRHLNPCFLTNPLSSKCWLGEKHRAVTFHARRAGEGDLKGLVTAKQKKINTASKAK